MAALPDVGGGPVERVASQPATGSHRPPPDTQPADVRPQSVPRSLVVWVVILDELSLRASGDDEDQLRVAVIDDDVRRIRWDKDEVAGLDGVGPIESWPRQKSTLA